MPTSSMPAAVSVIVTVLNEAAHLAQLLESLIVQEGPLEVLVVDAGSRDGTQDVVGRFAKDSPTVRLVHHPGRRGDSRNRGAREATGEYLAFIDGDCAADPFWLQRMRAAAGPRNVVAGRTHTIGYWAFERLQRVELEHKGQDVTYPSCNLLYPRAAFLDLGGFDPRFVTAEDIDLNFRAVESGLKIRYAPQALVYHRARESVGGFLHQAYWNGYGRKQLTLKHGQLWSQYSLRRMLAQHVNFWGLLRVTGATLGYLRCLMRESKREWRAARLAQPQEVRA